MRPSHLRPSWRFAPAVTLVLVAAGCTSTSPKPNQAALDALVVTPAAPGVAIGGTAQLKATGTYTDASVRDLTSLVAWSSSNGAVATLSNAAGSRGMATGVTEGTATVTAAYGSVSGIATLTVTPALDTLAIAPASPILNPGSTRTLTATGTFSDASIATEAATWSSSNSAVATIDASTGLCTGVGAGTTTIQANVGSTTASVTLTVGPASINRGWNGANTFTPNIPGSSLPDTVNLYDLAPFSYGLSYHFPYTLASFAVDTTGVYTAVVSTNNVNNTAWFLTGTFSPTYGSGFPTTPVGQFFIGVYSGPIVDGLFTDRFSGLAQLSLTAGTPYSVLVAYNGGAASNTATMALTGPGMVVFNAAPPS